MYLEQSGQGHGFQPICKLEALERSLLEPPSEILAERVWSGDGDRAESGEVGVEVLFFLGDPSQKSESVSSGSYVAMVIWVYGFLKNIIELHYLFTNFGELIWNTKPFFIFILLTSSVPLVLNDGIYSQPVNKLGTDVSSRSKHSVFYLFFSVNLLVS